MFLSWAPFKDFIKKQIIRVPPSLILVSSLALTIFTSGLTYLFETQLKQTYIEHKIENIKNFIESSIQSHIDSMIRPTQGLFVSSQFVDHKEFASFENVLQISNLKSGILNVSYIIRLPEAEIRSHTKMMVSAGFSDFSIWPKPTGKPGQDYFPITYIYPMDWRNKRALGYNVGHEEKRKLAMDLARDTGEAAMTGKIILVQEDNVDVQSGFIIFSPLYKKHYRVSTVEERRRALSGYIGGAFRTKSFFDQLMQELTVNVQHFKLELYDGEIADPKLLFFTFSSSGIDEQDMLSSNTTIEVANRKWLARITTTGARPIGLQAELHWFLLIVGLLVSLLLYLVTKLNLIQNMKLNQDIEMLRETKLHLQQAKESAEAASTLKGAFLANMSHEIRTPLSVIISSSNFLMSPQINADEKEKFAQIISRNGKHLLNIINDILDLSKIEAGMVSLEFAQILIRSELKDLEEDMRLLAQAKNISFQMQISDELPEFIGTDPSRMQQILRNIIGNAIKFTERGYVEVIVDSVKGDEIRFLVKDSGIGLSKEQQKNIFAPFSQADVTFTRKYGGSGLGLVLSKKLASLLGGDVTLKSSQSGAGSVFEINIKNKMDSANPYKLSPLERTPKNQFLLRGKKILLVEDSQDTQFVVTRILQLQGAEVTVAKNGAEGVAQALQQNFDLVLMDIQMPVMDGFAATKILREKGYTKPVFALTAHTQPQFKELSAEAGFDNYLSKPFQIDELLRKIRI